jgi:viologen exporter family transport system ATP-binding protein
LALPLARLGLAEDLGSPTFGAAEMRVDVIDVDDEPVDDERCLEPLTRERAGLGMPARTLIGVARMTDDDRRPVELEHDVGHRAHPVVKPLGLTESEDLADPLGGATRVFVREHRDHALLSHGRPPCFGANDALARVGERAHHAGVTEAVVDVRELRKTFRVTEREEGLAATLRSFVKRQRKDVNAVAGITFRIDPGEVVGFLGPNGAGKTTTLKMLSGLLHPTAGEARVLEYVPWRRENAYLKSMTLLMGNRTQLVWDIPAADSFRVLQEIYRIPEEQFRVTVDELTELLELQELVHKPVRNLSLGERMKVEFAAGLIHSPSVAFLDEPTIGLDVSMQVRIRRFVAEYNRRTGATILLTSHYMDDVVALCKRVIVIHRGRLLYDGPLADLAERMAPYKVITATLHDGSASSTDLDAYGTVVSREEGRVTMRVDRQVAPERTARLVNDLGSRLADISVEDPPIEEVIDRVFTSEQTMVSA